MYGPKQNSIFGYHQFEPRQLLAGDVSVSFSAGVLDVTGDSLANEFQIVGTPDGGVTLNGIANTTVNNGNNPFVVASGVRQVNLRLGEGNDSIEIVGLVLSDRLNIDGQLGNDNVKIRDLNTSFLIVDGGDGNDVLEFHNTFSRREIRILGQEGNDTVSITAMATDRNFHLDTGAGSDTIAINHLGVRKSIFLSAGAGDDTVMTTGEVYGYKTEIRLDDGNDTLGVLPTTNAATATFRRELDVKAGAGVDRVLLGQEVTSSRKTSLDGEADNDSLGTTGSVMNRPQILGFEDQQLANLTQALDGFYSRLTTAGVDTTPFGRVPANVSAPVLSVNNTALAVAESASPVRVDDQLTLTGSEGTAVTGATIKVAANDPARDVLAFANTTAITGSFDVATGTLALSGSATLADYQAALRSVTYDDLRNPSVAGTKQVDFSIASSAGAATDSRTLNVQGLAAPTFRVTDTPLELDRSAIARVIDDQIVLTGDGFNVTGATVRAVGVVADRDLLAFTNTAGITGTFEAATGVLTLTGTATLPVYQTALRTITYDNSSSTFTGTKLIEFSIATERGSVQDSRNIQILSDAAAIQGFSAVNGLQLQQTASGLQYVIATPGNNDRPTNQDSVRVKYRGSLLNGTQFDANTNALFPLSGVIPGFREGLLLFSEGATGQIFIPSTLAYGEPGTTNIPPNAILRFEIELLEVIAAT